MGLDPRALLDERAVVTVPEAAEILGVTPNFAYELVASGELPSLRLGRSIRVPTSGLRRLLEVETGDPVGQARP